jgi:hypothetical protein
MSAAAALPDAGIERWELHSELVLVSAEVRARALELLPKRDPDEALDALRRAIRAPRAERIETEPRPALHKAVVVYAAIRIVQTAQSSLSFVAGVAALALLVELLHG